MPHPIPDWDLPRVLIQYIINRQASGNAPTLQEIGRRTSSGTSRLLSILEDQGIDYLIFPENNYYYKNKIVIFSVPEKLTKQYGLLTTQALKNIKPILAQKEMKQEDWKKLKKIQRQKEREDRIRYFLKEDSTGGSDV